MLREVKPADPSISVAYQLVEGDPVSALTRVGKEEGSI